MYRHRDNNRGRGFVFGIRSVVLRDNCGEISSDKCSHAYTQHALHSFKHIEQYNIKKYMETQKTQIEYRNMFDELPSHLLS